MDQLVGVVARAGLAGRRIGIEQRQQSPAFVVDDRGIAVDQVEPVRAQPADRRVERLEPGQQRAGAMSAKGAATGQTIMNAHRGIAG